LGWECQFLFKKAEGRGQRAEGRRGREGRGKKVFRHSCSLALLKEVKRLSCKRKKRQRATND